MLRQAFDAPDHDGRPRDFALFQLQARQPAAWFRQRRYGGFAICGVSISEPVRRVKLAVLRPLLSGCVRTGMVRW